MLRSKLKFATILLAVTFTAASCLGPQQTTTKRVELTWWRVFSDSREVQPIIKAFETANKGVKLRFVEKNIETYEDELVNALAAGTGPDIFSIHNDWLPKHIAKMAPAPEAILGLRELREQYASVLETDLTSAGQIYALPLNLDILALYYNKDLLSSSGIARPPATWEELVTMVPKLTVIDRLGNISQSAIALGTVDNVNRATDILSLLMLQNGTQIIDPDGRSSGLDKTVRDQSGAQTSPGTGALEFYTQFADPAKTSYTWNSRSNNSIDAFAAGQVAMILSYAYLEDTLREKAPFLNYGVAAAPQISGEGTKINYANYWADGVSKQSQNADTAWQFLKFASSKNALTAYYEKLKQISPRLDLLETQISDPDIGLFAENAVSAKSFVKPDSGAIEQIFADMINDVVQRHISVKDAIRAASAKINLLLKTRR